MMRRLIGFLVLSLLIFSCTKSGKPTALSPTMRPSGSDLAIEWGVITNDYGNGGTFLAELSIINNSEHSFATSGWTMYFNYNACRAITYDSLPDFIKITHINGDFYKMTPTTKFLGLNKGEKITIPIIGSAWSIKNTDVPGGFYFVFDDNGKSSKPESSTFKLSPAYATANQINKTKADKNIIPTATTRFDANKNLSLLPSNQVQRIIPTPQVIILADDQLVINASFTIRHQEELKSEANYLATSLKKNFGVKPALSADQSKTNKSINLVVGKVTVNGVDKKKGDEAYILDITKDNITITGSDNAGVFYGLQSLRALLPVSTYGTSQKDIALGNVHIEDAPGFSYRGMHLDVARNFQKKESVLKLLDMMAFYKLNKFHFHIIDDEGWRLQIEELPELTTVGSKRGHTLDESDKLIPSYGSGAFADASVSAGTGFYTRKEFIDILKYANERHIEVIPELDMPGHARAAIKAMNTRYNKFMANGQEDKAKEYLLVDLNDKSEYSSVQMFNDNVVCVCQSSTYKFLETVLDDVVKMYQEAGVPLSTIHTGGDEVPHGVWEKSPVCEQFIKDNQNIKDVKELKGHFLTTFSQMIADRGLATAGWEEIGMHLDMVDGKEVKTINPDLVGKGFMPYIWNSVYGWGGEEIGYKLANAGYKVVLSNVTNLYFDLAYDKDPAEPGFYWGGFVTTETAYLFQPYDVYSSLKVDLNGNPIPQSAFTNKVQLTEQGRANIQGIQGQLWSENTKNAETLEYLIFPRLISLAERAWAPTPSWTGKGEAVYNQAWNNFANAIGQRELTRMDNLYRGVLYRIPMPGAKITNGTLTANVTFPGLTIRYTTDGTEPTATSMEYTEAVQVTGDIKLKTFTSTGRASRTLLVK
jgi:hexosaminidase